MSATTDSTPIDATIVEAAPRPARDLAEQPAVRLREFASILLMVALADITLYWGNGYTGIGAFLLLGPAILFLGLPRPRFCVAGWIAVALLALVVLRLCWYGTPLRVACGVAVLTMVIAALQAGRVNWGAVLSPLQAPFSGVGALVTYARSGVDCLRVIPTGWLLSVGIPIVALLAFGTLFVLANPDVSTVVINYLRDVNQILHSWVSALSPPEAFFWLATALLTAGFLRPLFKLPNSMRSAQSQDIQSAQREGAKPHAAALYPAFRNALVAVIGLFALYLVFEFKTLWLREFPEGFYYAGYAHRGAFWLTVALALATATLSVIFRGDVFDDPRLPTLRRLAWVWSLLNGLLVIAVYNRLFIYINFNGLTHMRIVGILGISAVVAGFALVVWKIAREHNFVWLLSRQVWALALTVLIYAMLPIDAIAVRYNVRQIMAGHDSAVMQIGVQPIDTEAVLALTPLLDYPNPPIQAGVRALLAEKYTQLLELERQREKLGWTAHQLAEDYALDRLRPLRSHWSEFEDTAARETALQQFHDYAYQWY